MNMAGWLGRSDLQASKENAMSDTQNTDAAGAPLPEDYEGALAELEQLVQHLESGELSLEQSINAYQRGVELAKVCQQRLEKAEQQVKVLQGQLLKPLSDNGIED